MKKIVIVDTNFLVKNLGKIKDTVEELKEKRINILVPELVKEEFINIQIRKLEEVYKELESLKNSYCVLRLKYKEKEKAREEVEDDNVVLYFITIDGTFIKYKRELEKEILETTSKKITILEDSEKSKILKELDIIEENAETTDEIENIFHNQKLI